MKSLKEILTKTSFTLLQGSLELQIAGLSLDSRKIEENWAFLAIQGTNQDGRIFIESAIEKGAIVILCEQLPKNMHPEIAYVLIQDLRKKAGKLAANFYNHPSQKLKLVGVTGTNGKTSVVTLLHQFMGIIGIKAGLLSTIHNKIGDKVIPANLTTPDAISLQKYLAAMVKEKCQFAFMEVSSHAIHQDRISGCHFSMGIFTNISHDHLDYHRTFKEYIRVKKIFFDNLSDSAFALINGDDSRAKVMVQNTRAKVSTFAISSYADFKGKIMENNSSGLHLQINQIDLHTQLVAAFNAYNLLAVYGAMVLFGFHSMDSLQVISQLNPPPGRFEVIKMHSTDVVGIVDYAHTPDALKHVLKTIRKIRKKGASVITVVGCGGDRDRSKRPKMAKIASDYSEQVILTSDNPRNEDPQKILADMQKGVPDTHRSRVLTIENRKEAIKTALLLARDHDMVLVAGKGHETYQETKGERLPFDDKKVMEDCFAMIR